MPNYGHLSLSCAKIERPSPLEKPSCKVRLFAQNRSRNYRQKVTAASSISNHFSSRFSASRTNAPRSLSRVKAGTHSALLKESHTAAHTAKHRAFRMGGAITTLGAFHTFTNIPGPGIRTASFAAFGAWSGAPKERRKPSEQRCAYARRCSEASRPRWAA